MQKIAFRLNSDKAVEYANAHRETGTEYLIDENTLFHQPAIDRENYKFHLSFVKAPGYTDVTENFERDYWGPWKDKLASDNAPSISEEKLYSAADMKRAFYKGFDKCNNDDANCYTAWREEAQNLLTPKQ